MAIRTYQGVAYPAQCDAMGHMNVQYYIAAFDQSLWHLVAACGYRQEWIAQKHEGWADVRYEIDFRNELPVGHLFVVDAEVVRIGRSSMVTRHIMRHQGEETIAAELLATSVYFDLAARKAHAIPDVVRDGATGLLAEAPAA